MKKTCYRKMIIRLFFAACLVLFNISCGLDTFYVIEPPFQIIKQPLYNSTDFNERYFEFYTNETTDISGFNFQGTNVYYRIYDSSSKLDSEVSTLNAKANDVENNSNVANYLIETYKYQSLTYENNTTITLIPNTGENKKVKIRLSDYQSSYPSEISFSNQQYKPMRSINGNLSFNFGRNGKNDKKPVADDADFNSSSSSDSKYYVAMFAVGVGTDAAYSPYYSNILYLGAVTIDSAEYDN